jgi:hypothetical protein
MNAKSRVYAAAAAAAMARSTLRRAAVRVVAHVSRPQATKTPDLQAGSGA